MWINKLPKDGNFCACYIKNDPRLHDKSEAFQTTERTWLQLVRLGIYLCTILNLGVVQPRVALLMIRQYQLAEGKYNFS